MLILRAIAMKMEAWWTEASDRALGRAEWWAALRRRWTR